MSCKLVTGEPGAGKSLFIMKELIDVITGTNLPIVTNMPIRVDPWMLGDKPQMGLRAYLEQNYDEIFDIDTRLRFLEDSECAEFYTHRGNGIDVGITRAEKRKGDDEGAPLEVDIQAAAAGGGVVYVIDECWKFFGARDWQTTGKALTFYGKQHRKLGDEIWLATHDFKDVDTAIRRIVEQTIVMRNHARMRIGPFRQPGYFSAEHYARVPSGVGGPMNTARFRLDAAGLCQCYDTSAGVGLKGGAAADTKAKRSGLHFGWIIAVVVVLALAATQIPMLAGKLVGKAALSGAKSAVKATGMVGTNTLGGTTNVPVVAPVRAAVESVAAAVRSPLARFDKDIAPLAESEVVVINGLVRSPVDGKVWIWLSDGSRYTSTDAEVGLLTEKYVVIENRVYRWPKNLLPDEKQRATPVARTYQQAPPVVPYIANAWPRVARPKPAEPIRGGL